MLRIYQRPQRCDEMPKVRYSYKCLPVHVHVFVTQFVDNYVSVLKGGFLPNHTLCENSWIPNSADCFFLAFLGSRKIIPPNKLRKPPVSLLVPLVSHRTQRRLGIILSNLCKLAPVLSCCTVTQDKDRSYFVTRLATSSRLMTSHAHAMLLDGGCTTYVMNNVKTRW